MGGSSSQTPAQTTTTSDPWSGVQPSLGVLYNSANSAFQGDAGYHQFPGNLLPQLSPDLATAKQLEYNIADAERFGSPGVNAARQAGLLSLQNEGLTAGQRGVANNYGQVYSDASGQQNPFLNSMIEASNRQIGDRVNSAFSGSGRYGSGAHANVATRAMAEAADPVLAQDYAQRQQTRLGALQGQAGVYGQGAQTAGQWASVMPTLDEARYAPQQHLENYGNFYQNRINADLANTVANWNAQEARPWEQLSRYANILSGGGGLGGTKVTTQNPYQPSTLQRIGGGAIAGAGLGASFGGPTGAGVGALGGGLLGML